MNSVSEARKALLETYRTATLGFATLASSLVGTSIAALGIIPKRAELALTLEMFMIGVGLAVLLRTSYWGQLSRKALSKAYSSTQDDLIPELHRDFEDSLLTLDKAWWIPYRYLYCSSRGVTAVLVGGFVFGGAMTQQFLFGFQSPALTVIELTSASVFMAGGWLYYNDLVNSFKLGNETLVTPR